MQHGTNNASYLGSKSGHVDTRKQITPPAECYQRERERERGKSEREALSDLSIKSTKTAVSSQKGIKGKGLGQSLLAT